MNTDNGKKKAEKRRGLAPLGESRADINITQ